MAILITLKLFLPIKTIVEVGQRVKWNILKNIFGHIVPHFWPMTSFWPKNDVILDTFHCFDQFWAILTNLKLILPTKTMVEVGQHDNFSILKNKFGHILPHFWLMTSFWQEIGSKGGPKHKTANYEDKWDFTVPKIHSWVVKLVCYLK